jgi:hypothetical protein
MPRILPLAFAVLAAVGAGQGAAIQPTAPDVAAFDGILKSYVEQNGAVHYGPLKMAIEPLNHFIEQIGAVSPDSHPALFPARAHQLAYWINAYNALVIWAMVKEYPEKKNRLGSPAGQDQFFNKKFFKVGGRSRTLDDIETNAIRKQFREPRIHFAIVCVSKGCPWLAREAFTPERLEEQLDRRTRLFLNQERNVHVDTARGEVSLSSLFDWYKQDFGVSMQAVLGFIGKYRPDGALLRQGKWTVRYLDYDWEINEAK